MMNRKQYLLILQLMNSKDKRTSCETAKKKESFVGECEIERIMTKTKPGEIEPASSRTNTVNET